MGETDRRRAIPYANLLTLLRILCALLLPVTEVFSPAFYGLYLLGGVSDGLDGPVARRTHTESKGGAMLDSVADLQFLLSALFCFAPLLREAPLWLWLWTAGIALLRLGNVLRGFLTQGKPVLLHTGFNRVTGLLLFLFPLVLPWWGTVWPGAAVCLAATVASVQEGYLVWNGKTI